MGFTLANDDKPTSAAPKGLDLDDLARAAGNDADLVGAMFKAQAEAEEAQADADPGEEGTPRERALSRHSRLLPASAWLDMGRPPPQAYLLRTTDTATDTTVSPSAWEGCSHKAPPPARMGVLPRGMAAVLAGAGGVGKSTAVVDLALALAASGGGDPGEGWLGGAFRVDPEAHKQGGSVLLVLGEEDADEWRRKLWHGLCARHGVTVPDLDHPPGDLLARIGAGDAVRNVRGRLCAYPASGQALTLSADERGQIPSDWHADLLAILAEPPDGIGWALVVLDPLSRFGAPESETDNHAATALVSLCERLTEAPGNPTVLVIHHTRKDGRGDAADIRGATGLVNGFRWAGMLAPVSDNPSDGAVFKVVKSNRAGVAPALCLSRVGRGRLVPTAWPPKPAKGATDAQPTARDDSKLPAGM